MTECDILMYLFATFSVAGSGLIFIAARIRQRYIYEIKSLKVESECEARRYEIIKAHALDLRKKNQDLQALIAKHKEQA